MTHLIDVGDMECMEGIIDARLPLAVLTVVRLMMSYHLVLLLHGVIVRYKKDKMPFLLDELELQNGK